MNRDILARGGLNLLNEVGLEDLTLRRLASDLNVRAGALYWHFKNKQELLDEMASIVLGEAAPDLVSKRRNADWTVRMMVFGSGLRKTLLRFRDGARMVSGTKLTNTEYLKASEAVAGKLLDAGFTVRQGVVLVSTVYHYTLSFVLEEQVVILPNGKRSDLYDLKERRERLLAEPVPLVRWAGPILFDGFDRRYREGLALILQGANCQLTAKRK